MNRWLAPSLLSLLFVPLACSDAPAPEESEAPATSAAEAEPAEAETPAPRVFIDTPAEGVEIDGPAVEVTLRVENLTIVPAGQQEPNSGHHHLFLDADVSPAGEPMPAEEGRIVHMGDGSTVYRFENVSPGQHRLIAVIGDWQHVPLEPSVEDTVTFTVR